MLGTVFSQYTFLTDLTQSSGLFKLSRWFQPAPKAEIHTSSYPYLEQDGKKWVAYDNLGSLISSLDIYSEANLCILSHFSHAPLFVSSWTVACQAPLSMGISRPENWGGLTFSFWTQFPISTLAGGFFTTIASWKANL